MQNEESGRGAYLQRWLHLTVLSTLAIAYPLLSVIQKRPQFLSARGAVPAEIYAMVVLLCAGIPTILFLLELPVVSWSRKAANYLHLLFMSLLFALLFLPFLSRSGARSLVVLPAAFALGFFLAFLNSRFANVRSFVNFLSLALIAVPYNFLTFPAVARAIQTTIPKYATYTGPAPRNSVVLLVLDEFPLVSLLNEKKEVDEERYPVFAGLTRTATWYRNATTTADETLLAIPSLVTGSYADNTKLPELKDYPANILSYFSPSFRMNVFESFTYLGPDSSRELREAAIGNRLLFLMEDLTAVYLHLLLPEDLRRQLPPVEQTWGGFWRPRFSTGNIVQVAKPRFNRHLVAERMTLSLKKESSPSFNYLHLMLPHIPLEHLSSGRMYDGRSFGPTGGDGLLREDQWQNQQQPVIRAFQRHLLQAMFADKVLGRILQRLREEQMFDDAMIIITSDHGLSFIPGQWRRLANSETMGDVAPIPFFIKYPYQTEGRVEDGNVELIDIAPTIAEVVGASLPWKVDGVSLRSTPAPARANKRILRHTDGVWLTPNASDISDALDRQLIRKLALFGSGAIAPLYTMNAPAEWIGKPVDSIPIAGDSPYKARLKYGETLEDVDLSKDPLPCLVRGRILDHKGAIGSLRIALAMNGRIEAITRDEYVWNWPKDEMVNIFAAMVPESALRNGKNRVDLFLMTEESGTSRFRRIPLVP